MEGQSIPAQVALAPRLRAAYTQIVQAFGGYGERVEKPAGIPAALKRALRVVRREGRQAVLHVPCRAS